MLTNNNANLKRIKDRITALEMKASTDFTGWKFSSLCIMFE